jgi:hypothetical protein
VSREAAYARALAWMETAHDRADIRVADHDPETATINASAEMNCNSSLGAGLRAMGLGVNQNYLRFGLQFQAKDGRCRIVFADLFYYLTDTRYPGTSITQGPSTQADVDMLYRDCLKDTEASLTEAIERRVTGADF